MHSRETARRLRRGGVTRRALLGALPFLLALGIKPASAQHEGHGTATDSTSRMRAVAAERRKWLGVRLALMGVVLALYLAWWRYQVVTRRRPKAAKKQGRDVGSPAEQPRPLPRQRRRR
jgi:hypothetical protein